MEENKEENTKEWLTIESLVAGLADIAREIKSMKDKNTSDECLKTSYKDKVGKFLR